MRQAEPPGRILLANAVRMWGGGERFVLDAAVGLRRRGWSVVVQAQPDSPLARRAVQAGIDVHPVRTRANGAPWTVLPLALWIRRNHFDVVLTNFDKDLRTAGLAARLSGVGGRPPKLMHSLECDEPLKPRWYLPLVYRRLCDHVLFNSESTRHTVVASAPWMAELDHSVLPKGIDPGLWAEIEPAPGSTGMREELVFGFVGQLVDRKDLPAALHALAALGETRRAWRLRVAGTGPRGESWKRRAIELGIAHRVHFDGFVDDLRTWLSDVDVLLHPSYREGWGYAVAEALAAGRIVIARASSSIPEVLGADAPGLYDADAAGALGAQLRRVLEAPPEHLRREAADNRRHAVEQLSIDRMLDTLEDRLRRVLDA